MTKFIVSGPECSGKTTLAKKLSIEYNLNLVREYARDFLNKNKNFYEYKDLVEIANQQYLDEKKYKYEERCICDTDLITIKIWSEYKYQKCDSWIKEKVHEQVTENRIYLLCKPDIKWKYDSQRESEHNRNEIFDIYLKEIQEQNQPYVIIKGDKRFDKAKKFLDEIIN